MKRTIFIPVNNLSLPLGADSGHMLINQILKEIDKYHGKKKTFQAEVLLYISKPCMGMITAAVNAKNPWISALHISIDPDFDQKALDEVAKRMTGQTDLKSVFCCRVLPRELLDKKQQGALEETLLKSFAEVYLINIPALPETDELDE